MKHCISSGTITLILSALLLAVTAIGCATTTKDSDKELWSDPNAPTAKSAK